MNDKRSTFPLPLSSVTGGDARKPRVPAPVATPQTATRNAAHTAVNKGAALPPAAPGPAPRPPGYAQAHAPSAPVAQRSELMASEAVRRAMVGRVARQGVKDGIVLAAMEAVPRHLFIEPALSAQAYIDASLPIGHNQTISQPYIVARMIEAMRAGGQLVAPVGAQVQHLERITRIGKSEWTSETLEACHFVPLRPGTV